MIVLAIASSALRRFFRDRSNYFFVFVLPLALILLGWSVRLISAAVTRQRLGDAILLPLSVMLMTLVAAQALGWRMAGGPRWKGRVARV